MAVKITNKKPKSMNRRSHALNKTNHFQKPNMIKIGRASCRERV